MKQLRKQLSVIIVIIMSMITVVMCSAEDTCTINVNLSNAGLFDVFVNGSKIDGTTYAAEKGKDYYVWVRAKNPPGSYPSWYIFGPSCQYNFPNVQEDQEIDLSVIGGSSGIAVVNSNLGGKVLVGSKRPGNGYYLPLTGYGNRTIYAFYDIIPDPGYRVKDVTFNGTSLGAVTTYNFFLNSGYNILLVEFEEDVPALYIAGTAGAGGTITPSGNTPLNIGDNQSYKIVANTGYSIKNVKVDGVSQGAISEYIFTNVQVNHTIEAEFLIKTYTIISSAGLGGSITPQGSKTVSYGNSQSYVITADTGYSIKDVLSVTYRQSKKLAKCKLF